MNIPKNHSEKEVLEIIERISNSLSKRFKFAYYTVEDIKQEIYCEAIKGLRNYDGIRPLENFLKVHLKNRMINLRRDKYERPDKPCIKCPFFDKAKDLCSMFDNREDCELYLGWLKRNQAKKNIASPIDITSINDENEERAKSFDSVDDNLSLNEIETIIDEKLPVGIIREDYIRLKNRIKIPKARRVRVEETIKAILVEHRILDNG